MSDRREFKSEEERLRSRRASEHEGVRRHALRKAGKLPPPDEAGIERWWRERGR